MRIVCWTQHLSGVGHFVRMHAIANGLAAAHDAFIVNGGRYVPMPEDSPRLQRIRLHPVFRADGALRHRDRTDIATILEERSEQLCSAIAEIAADVLLIEHYPFSKWELESEILAAIEVARTRNPRVRIICSLRDIVPQTTQERVSAPKYRTRVTTTLNRWFDGLLVHADPSHVLLDDTFAGVAEIAVPVAYTGLVVTEETTPRAPPSAPHAVVSCGGGASDFAFIDACIGAFRELLREDRRIGDCELAVFPGLFISDQTRRALAGLTHNIRLFPFSASFGSTLQTALLSISRAGYNTCARILNHKIRALVVPDSRMSDQSARAELMAKNGWATVVNGDPPSIEVLVEGMHRAMNSPQPLPSINLKGVSNTRALLESDFGTRT